MRILRTSTNYSCDSKQIEMSCTVLKYIPFIRTCSNLNLKTKFIIQTILTPKCSYPKENPKRVQLEPVRRRPHFAFSVVLVIYSNPAPM